MLHSANLSAMYIFLLTSTTTTTSPDIRHPRDHEPRPSSRLEAYLISTPKTRDASPTSPRPSLPSLSPTTHPLRHRPAHHPPLFHHPIPFPPTSYRRKTARSPPHPHREVLLCWSSCGPTRACWQCAQSADAGMEGAVGRE